MQDALVLSARPGIISFSLGLPSPDLFPVEQFTLACEKILGRGSSVLQYAPPSELLKSHIVSLMRHRGVECRESQIFLTSGAQQAVNLVVAVLLDSGRQIIAEELCYPGFRQIVEFYRPEVLTVPTDPSTGMDVDKVEWYLESGAKPVFVYAITEGHNPLGVSLSEEKRRKLLTLSENFDVPIIEEDPYGFLTYEPSQIRLPMRSQRADNVFYVGSFSKILAPSLRVGWLIVPEELTRHLAVLKETVDIDMSTFSQHVVAHMLDSGFLVEHLKRLRAEYTCRRDVMVKVLSKRFPSDSRWSVPDSGVFIWVRMPEKFDTKKLLTVAVDRHQVAYMPGSIFRVGSSGGDSPSSLRLNFSHPSVSCIDEGMSRLGDLFCSSANALACAE
jgi:2-aminoadipate transaminase